MILACLACTQEALYGKEVVVADREMVESEADRILVGADREDVAFLVVGDPFGCANFPNCLPRTFQQTTICCSAHQIPYACSPLKGL